MLDKALQIGFSALPDMKEKQNSNIGTVFLDVFDEERRRQIHEILSAGKYIPKEIGFCPIHIIRKRLPDSFSCPVDHSTKLFSKETMNERSFEIFRREKFIQK